MKSFILIPLILCFKVAVGQPNKIKDTLVVVNIPYAPASLQVSKDTSAMAYIEVGDRDQIAFQKLYPGSYTVILLRGTQRVEVLKSIFIQDTMSVVFKANNVGPCLYDHPPGYVTKCPFGDSDSIIPVIYGLPSPQDRKDAADKKVKLAGCTVDPCGPKFYCTKHQVLF